MGVKPVQHGAPDERRHERRGPSRPVHTVLTSGRENPAGARVAASATFTAGDPSSGSHHARRRFPRTRAGSPFHGLVATEWPEPIGHPTALDAHGAALSAHPGHSECGVGPWCGETAPSRARTKIFSTVRSHASTDQPAFGTPSHIHADSTHRSSGGVDATTAKVREVGS